MLNTPDSYCGHCIRYRVHIYSYCIRYTITLKVDTTWQYTITINVEHLIFFGGHCIRYRVYIYSYCICYTMTMKVDTTWRYTITINVEHTWYFFVVIAFVIVCTFTVIVFVTQWQLQLQLLYSLHNDYEGRHDMAIYNDDQVCCNVFKCVAACFGTQWLYLSIRSTLTMEPLSDNYKAVVQ